MQLQEYYLSLSNSVDYANHKEFWTVDFPKCKPRPLLYAVWEYPILVLASFYTLARTRLALLQTLFVILASGLVFLGQFYWLLAYVLPMYFLTLFLPWILSKSTLIKFMGQILSKKLDKTPCEKQYLK